MRYWRCVVALLAVLPLYALDVSGKWKGQIGDSGRDVLFQLKSEGTKVTGSMSGPDGEPRPITEGQLNGDNISLTITSEWQGSPLKLLVKGKVAGDQMNLTMEVEGRDWSREFVLKKAAD